MKTIFITSLIITAVIAAIAIISYAFYIAYSGQEYQHKRLTINY